MEKNLRKLVEDEIVYGRHHEIINTFTQSERQVYESQEFEWTNTGFLMKKKQVKDPDYDWDVLAFCKENPDLADKVRSLLDGGERLLRSIYTDRKTFETWSSFFDRLNAEGLDLGDHVAIDESFGTGPASEDAMLYTDNSISIETVGERGIYCIEFEEEVSTDWLGDLIDPYQQRNSLPRDKYKTIGYNGFNEPDPEGKVHGEQREDRLREILRSLNGTHHRAHVAKIRHSMSEHWAADKEVYAALKNRKMSLDDASEVMYLTASQWREAFAAADKAWFRANLYDEWYFSAEQKKKRQIRSNDMRDHYKAAILDAQTTDEVTNLMRHVNGQFKIGFLWKNDYKEVYGIASLQWQTLNKQGKHRVDVITESEE